VLGRLVSSLDTSVPVVVVGPSRPLERSVRWARESPVGGGPLAGLEAGLTALQATPAARSDGATWVVVIAGDQPFAAAAVPALLSARRDDLDAVVGMDAGGRAQPLLAAYRVSALDIALTGSVAGRSMYSLLDGLVSRRVELPSEAMLDVDDAPSLERARELAAPPRPQPRR
jgi:molybdopterin-guanine dinucleotide biosynthesis protein A